MVSTVYVTALDISVKGLWWIQAVFKINWSWSAKMETPYSCPYLPQMWIDFKNPFTARTEDNVVSVDKLVLSQQELLQIYRSTRQIAHTLASSINEILY